MQKIVIQRIMNSFNSILNINLTEVHCNVRFGPEDYNVTIEAFYILQEIESALGLKSRTKNVKDNTIILKDYNQIKQLGLHHNVRQLRLIHESGVKHLMLNNRKEIGKVVKQNIVEVVKPDKLDRLVLLMEEQIKSVNNLIAMFKDNMYRDPLIQKNLLKEEEIVKYLPENLPQVPGITPRMLINQIIRNYCTISGSNYENCFNTLYYQFKYRSHYDLKLRAHYANMAPLDVAEKIGKIDDLLALSKELFLTNK